MESLFFTNCLLMHVNKLKQVYLYNFCLSSTVHDFVTSGLSYRIKGWWLHFQANVLIQFLGFVTGSLILEFGYLNFHWDLQKILLKHIAALCVRLTKCEFRAEYKWNFEIVEPFRNIVIRLQTMLLSLQEHEMECQTMKMHFHWGNA